MSETPTRILVIGAHPADPFERAGGTLANHLARGDEAFVVSLTHGVVTHAFTSFPATGADKLRDIDRVKGEKRREFEDACALLGVTGSRLYDLPESPLLYGMDEFILLVDLMREIRPRVLLCAHPVEVGRFDHMDSGTFILKAADYARAEGFPSPLAPHAIPEIFLFYYQVFSAEQLMGTSRHAPDVIVDTTASIEKKLALMTIFGRTQTKAGEDYEGRMRVFLERGDGAVGYKHGFGGGRGYGEQFTRWHPARGPYLPLSG